MNPSPDDWFELVDFDGDPLVVRLQNPVPPEMVVALWERFGGIHEFLITDLVRDRRH